MSPPTGGLRQTSYSSVPGLRVGPGILAAVVSTIVSGGQTGVDRAALDVALELGIPCGGWCPAGRRAKDGRIDDRYPLRETPSPAYRQRTEWNVRDSDATLILARPPLAGGTALTVRLAGAYRRPLLVADPAEPTEVERVRRWLAVVAPVVLNVAGLRDDPSGAVYRTARSFLLTLFRPLTSAGPVP